MIFDEIRRYFPAVLTNMILSFLDYEDYCHFGDLNWLVLHSNTITDAKIGFEIASKYDDIAVMKLMSIIGFGRRDTGFDMLISTLGYDHRNTVYETAVKCNSLLFLKHLVENDNPGKIVIRVNDVNQICCNNNIPMMRYILDNPSKIIFPVDLITIPEQLLKTSIRLMNIDMVKLAVEYGATDTYASRYRDWPDFEMSYYVCKHVETVTYHQGMMLLCAYRTNCPKNIAKAVCLLGEIHEYKSEKMSKVIDSLPDIQSGNY